MHRSPSLEHGVPHKRTRAQVGTTNRKSLQSDDMPDLHAKASPPRLSTSSTTTSSLRLSPDPHRTSTAMQSTAASIGKAKRSQRETVEAKERKQAEKAHLETMRCKFVETFEDGKNNLKTSMLYVDPNLPPTRFSCVPPVRDTSYLTTGERGSPAYIAEEQRLSTTYHANMHPHVSPGGERLPEVVNENAQRKAQAKEREAGRLARIRDNNARVDAMTDAYHSKIVTDDSRRIATVKKQQEGYAQAIAIRQARGID